MIKRHNCYAFKECKMFVNLCNCKIYAICLLFAIIGRTMLNRFKKIMLIGGDILLLFSALWLTLLIRYWELPDRDNWLQNLSPFSVLFAVWLVVFYISGLYDTVTSRNDIDFYNRIIAVLLINYGLATAYFY